MEKISTDLLGDSGTVQDSMELKLNKDEYTVGYARVSGGALILTNFRLLIDRGFKVFGKKTKSIQIKDITDLKFNKSFLFGTGIDMKYIEENREYAVFIEFTVSTEAKEIMDKMRSLQKGEILAPFDVPKGEMGRISLEEAEQIALKFMGSRAKNLEVDEIRHIAGAWNIILSNQEKYAVVVSDDGTVEAWKKLTKI
ncbi:MAG: hypothetical protein O8C66_09360 [Candidatus Methanoperedens sp.]|nr:hypothetical protein [Candidatus Methanoperedens sp.]MCZ7370702.1 hypothetical protein [Candidatus Methanoperedens sp.]